MYYVSEYNLLYLIFRNLIYVIYYVWYVRIESILCDLFYLIYRNPICV